MFYEVVLAFWGFSVAGFFFWAFWCEAEGYGVGFEECLAVVEADFSLGFADFEAGGFKGVWDFVLGADLFEGDVGLGFVGDGAGLLFFCKGCG